MARIQINKDVCLGCGLCAQFAPGVIELDASGKAALVKVDADVSEVETAASSCPVGAIVIE